MTYDPIAYDNRGFADLDAKHDFEDYMERATDFDGPWSPYDADNMADALGDVDQKRLVSDCHLFLLAYRKGDYKTCADIFFQISDEFCTAMAKADYTQTDI
jgi:hypothetical protein